MTMGDLRKNLKIVIKTKDRIKKLRNKTYNKIILKYGLNEKNVHLFVSDDKDLMEYTKAYPKCKVIKGPPGIAAIDNFIVKYFKEGEIYLYMNDDISGFKKATNPKTIRDVSKTEFYKVLQKMINECKKNGFTYGGFYPVPNPYFMYNGTKGKEIRYDLCMVMDPLSICFNNKTVKLTTIKVKKPDGSTFSGESSDAEKCILHYKDRGGLVRFNQYAAIVEYYGKQGGYQGRNIRFSQCSSRFRLEVVQERVTNSSVGNLLRQPPMLQLP